MIGESNYSTEECSVITQLKNAEECSTIKMYQLLNTCIQAVA